MSDRYYPLHSLEEGHWFKLICGASFQDLSAVRNLALSYSLAGADCIDVAADPAVITAAKEGIAAACQQANIARKKGFSWRGTPWLMVSLNDGEDPHFRKAEFNPTECPTDCPRPCEDICPASAITFSGLENNFSGVIEQRCYGCGRCLPVCPSQLIFTRSYVSTPATILPLIRELGIDALEIHTQVGHENDFQRLWQAIAPFVNRLKLLAISCPDAPGLIDYLENLYDFISPLPIPLIWQTDGRPMSGDIGKGTTHAAIALAKKVLQSGLTGYIQLAGGTNGYTVTKLQDLGLLKLNSEDNLSVLKSTENQPQSNFISGVAYGSYARSLLSPILEDLETMNYSYSLLAMPTNQLNRQLENNPKLLWQAVKIARALVSQLKLISERNISAS
ncbi:MAG: LdpA C-terminal domain-containing domain [Xenococcaceae cyanobacterium MO_188.B32]|nr:LdpA C-terminal domain-containing domain [Xenococcaceae cyanobacterium MO_188.B32]